MAPTPSPLDLDSGRERICEIERKLEVFRNDSKAPGITTQEVGFLIDQNRDLLAEVRELRNGFRGKMRCEQCRGWFEIASLQSASVDPESDPVCDRCLELAAADSLLREAADRLRHLGGDQSLRERIEAHLKGA